MWQRLGPIGPRTAHLVAVSPDWPTDPLLLAARPHSSSPGPGPTTSWQPDLVRSLDAGRTWESLPSPADSLRGLVLAKTPGNAHAAFAWSDDGLVLSPDAGSTWQKVLAPESTSIDDIQLSPNLAIDGLAFALAGGTLWRSRDAGHTWQSAELQAGQWVHRIRFSPDFATDKTLFAALAGGPFPSGGPGSNNASAPTGEPESSAGVLVSQNTGDTWTPINNGLQVDESSYQAIQELEVSPTFARDNTLFALGWGPYESVPFFGGEAPAQRAVLFRSRDRGASWEPVQAFDPSVTRFHLQLAISPRLADDHILLEAFNGHGPSPSSSHCILSWSGDGGSSWIQKLPPGNYEGCSHLQVFGTRGGSDAGNSLASGSDFEAMVLKSSSRYWSPDSGRTWAYASAPTGLSAAVPSPNYAQDRMLFLPALGGVWSNGPSAAATDGMLPCAFTPAGGFGRLWTTNSGVRATLGCALQPEQSMPIREREYTNQNCGPTRVLWPDDPSVPFFYELSANGCGAGYLRVKQKGSSPLPDAPERTVQGAMQLFEGGRLLFLAESDTRRIIVLLSDQSEWQQFADAPPP